jgi:hypothetical protein
VRNGVRLACGGPGIAGGAHQVVKAAQDEASCAVRPQKRRAFCLQSASACFGGISQKLTRAPQPLAMAVQKLQRCWRAHQRRREHSLAFAFPPISRLSPDQSRRLGAVGTDRGKGER